MKNWYALVARANCRLYVDVWGRAAIRTNDAARDAGGAAEDDLEIEYLTVARKIEFRPDVERGETGLGLRAKLPARVTLFRRRQDVVAFRKLCEAEGSGVVGGGSAAFGDALFVAPQERDRRICDELRVVGDDVAGDTAGL